MAGLPPSPDTEFEYDVFVSYAHADDWALREGEPGWVHSLVVLIGKIAGSLLPPLGLRRYIDHQLAAGESVPNALLRALERSRVLLLVLSPRYLASVWCQSELESFLERSGKSVIVVESVPTDRATWPRCLDERDLKTAKLWELDAAETPVRLDPSRKQYSDLYDERVNKLAYDIIRELHAPETTPSKGDVWVAEPTDDVRKEWEELAGALDQAGWRVLPRSDYPIQERGPFVMRLRGHLQRATLFVQLIGSYEGRRVEGDSSSPLPLAQAIEAHSISQQRGVPWLRWRSKGTAAADRGTAESPLLNKGEIQEGQFAEFKRRVLETLDALVRTVPRQEQPAASSDLLMVDVRCDAGDRALAEKVQHSLKEFDVDSIILPGVNRIEELNNLQGCDGVIVIYGTTPVPWVQAQFSLLRRAFGTVRPKGTIGILKAPPPPKETNLGISSDVLETLDGTAGIDPAVLAGFVERVRAESAQSRSHA
jgi:hypothetical protein